MPHPFRFLCAAALGVLVRADGAMAQVVLHQLEGTAAYGRGDLDADGRSDLVVMAATEVRAYSGRDGSLLHAWPLGTTRHAGDVNADGFGDVVVGDLLGDSGGIDSGTVDVWSGRDGARLYQFSGASNDGLGSAVSSAGDVNLDGFVDVVAYARSTVGIDKSYLRVFSGRDGSVLFTHEDHPSEFASVSHVGDVNADGHADFCELWVAAHAFIFSGKDFSILLDLPPRYDGAQTVAEGAGDVDADGHDDIVLGQPLAWHLGASVGAASVRSGATGNELFSFFGSAPDDRLGSSAGASGDVNQDGHADIVVGARQFDAGGLDAGAALVFSGREGALLRTIHGRGDGDRFGQPVVWPGDVDGDGLPDLMATASHGTVVLSGARTAAGWSSYGAGWPGKNGIVPQLEPTGMPILCSTIELELGNSRRIPTQALVFVGVAPASIPTALGGTLLVQPIASFPVRLPGIGLQIPVNVPCSYSVAGAAIYLQALEEDPAASHGVSFTRGLELVLGY